MTIKALIAYISLGATGVGGALCWIAIQGYRRLGDDIREKEKLKYKEESKGRGQS